MVSKMKNRSLFFDGSKIVKRVGERVPPQSKPLLITLLNLLKTGEFFIRGAFVKVQK